MNSTALVVIIFNRPDLVEGLFTRIAKHAPARLYLVADGPREAKPDEARLCSEARKAAEGMVTWPCKLTRIYSSENLGCRLRIVTGLDFVFDREECAIILEDDTYPHRDFFHFCETMLDRYAADESIFSITGTNIFGHFSLSSVPFLSDFTHIWGWATWRRSWRVYDRDLSSYKDGSLLPILSKKFGEGDRYRHWVDIFERLRMQQLDTWDYQLQATAWLHGARCLTPQRNLITNVGFRADASHTSRYSLFAELGCGSVPMGDSRIDRGSSYFYDFVFCWVFHAPPRLVGYVCRVASVLKRISRKVSHASY